MTPQQALKLIYGAAKRIGPRPAMYANLSHAMQVVYDQGYTAEDVKTVLINPSDQNGCYNFISTIFNQQYGYAGDWELLSKFYDAYDQGYTAWLSDEFGPPSKYTASNWDDYILHLSCGQSLYNREQYLLHEIGKLIEAKKVTKVLDVACGNGRLMKKLAVLYPHCIFHGIDNEVLAIEQALESRPNNCAFGVMNALTKLPGDQVDLVVSAGLCDYLGDRHFTRLVRRIEYNMDPKYVILGNLTQHESWKQMSLLRWNLIYRTSTDLVSLAANYFQEKKFRVGQEPLGVNLFLHIEPKE